MNHSIVDYRILIPANKENLRANRPSLPFVSAGNFVQNWMTGDCPGVSFIISRSDESFYLDLPSKTFTPSTPRHFHAISRDIPFSFLVI